METTREGRGTRIQGPGRCRSGREWPPMRPVATRCCARSRRPCRGSDTRGSGILSCMKRAYQLHGRRAWEHAGPMGRRTPPPPVGGLHQQSDHCSPVRNAALPYVREALARRDGPTLPSLGAWGTGSILIVQRDTRASCSRRDAPSGYPFRDKSVSRAGANWLQGRPLTGIRYRGRQMRASPSSPAIISWRSNDEPVVHSSAIHLGSLRLPLKAGRRHR